MTSWTWCGVGSLALAGARTSEEVGRESRWRPAPQLAAVTDTPPAGSEQRRVLILVDMQQDVIIHQTPRVREALRRSGVVEACAGALAEAHAIGMPVVFITVLRRQQEVAAELPYPPLRRQLGWRPACVEGTPGAAIVPELMPRPTDFVVTKRSRGGFHNTELDGLLRQLGVTHILLGGVSTNLGVESTARSAFDLGYRVTFLRECCAGFDEEDHEWAFRRIFPLIGEVSGWQQAFAGAKEDTRT